MKNILELIVENKRREVALKKKSVSEKQLMEMEHFSRDPLDVKSFFSTAKPNIIAEFKRKSPSKGIINITATLEEVVDKYCKGGAMAVSILTDELFFGGSLQDLQQARKYNVPLLRKDFIIDSYQIVESKAFGADMILLIAACLNKEEIYHLSSFAKSIGLSVLLEIHDADELDCDLSNIDMVGVNNRDLKTFKVDVTKSIEIAAQIPKEKLKIAESGISNAQVMKSLMAAGFDGFLIGEMFMKEAEPGSAFLQLMNEFQTNKNVSE